MAVSPIPAGYHSITPYLIVKGAAAAIEFYRSVLVRRKLCGSKGRTARLGMPN